VRLKPSLSVPSWPEGTLGTTEMDKNFKVKAFYVEAHLARHLKNLF